MHIVGKTLLTLFFSKGCGFSITSDTTGKQNILEINNSNMGSLQKS